MAAPKITNMPSALVSDNIGLYKSYAEKGITEAQTSALVQRVKAIDNL